MTDVARAVEKPGMRDARGGKRGGRRLRLGRAGAVCAAGLAAAFMGVSMSVGEIPAAADGPINEAFRCVVENVVREAAGEPLAGQTAVAAVTLARRDDPRWPSGLCAVVYQPLAFSWTLGPRKRPPTRAEWRQARLATVLAMAGWRPCPHARWYHRVDVHPPWAKRLRRTCRLGRHVFYRDP